MFQTHPGCVSQKNAPPPTGFSGSFGPLEVNQTRNTRRAPKGKPLNRRPTEQVVVLSFFCAFPPATQAVRKPSAFCLATNRAVKPSGETERCEAAGPNLRAAGPAEDLPRREGGCRAKGDTHGAAMFCLDIFLDFWWGRVDVFWDFWDFGGVSHYLGLTEFRKWGLGGVVSWV